MPSLYHLVCPFAGLALLTLGCGCKRLNEQMPITEQREVSAYASKPPLFVSSEERFSEAEPPKKEEEPGQPEQPGEPPKPFLDHTTPPGWVEAPPRGSSSMGGMRIIDMRFGKNQEGECYLSMMPGSAGGMAANINRWRGQMGLPPYTEEQIQNLPKKPFLTHEAVFVDFGGDYKGVGAEQSSKGYHLLGLLMEAPQFTLFVKMIGPEALVDGNKKEFDEFCQSIALGKPAE